LKNCIKVTSSGKGLSLETSCHSVTLVGAKEYKSGVLKFTVTTEKRQGWICPGVMPTNVITKSVR